ncbi:MAG: DUF86 domain-containing protein [Candidatus Methanoperedens sp.]|nr:DUF86 domain-containing protein [Candidatus Methanoperedens sp.]
MKNEILNKLERLQKYVKILDSYKKYGILDINEDFTLRGAIERYLEVSLECVLDIGEMVISKEGFRKPETYKEVIEILGEVGILPEDFAERFAEAAKFRNILVHMYAEVDVEMVYEILQNNLGDFDEFAKYIAGYLEKGE